MKAILAASAAALLTLTACGTNTGTTTPPPSETSIETTTTPAAATDVTSEIRNLGDWGDTVTDASLDGQHLVINTTLIDPRTDGSADGAQAVEICEAAVTWMNNQGIADQIVRVQEDDGTTFALKQPPRYPDCVEI